MLIFYSISNTILLLSYKLNMINYRFKTSTKIIEEWMGHSLGGYDEVHFGGMFLEQCQVAINMGYMPPVPISDQTSLWWQGGYSCCTLDIAPPAQQEEILVIQDDFKVGLYAIAYKSQDASSYNPYYAQIREVDSQEELDEFVTSFFQLTDDGAMIVKILWAENKYDLLIQLSYLSPDCIPIAWG